MNTKISLNKLYIIADFDHTITTIDSQNCWGILSKIPNISPNYIKESRENHKYYFKIEQDDKVDYETKNQIMRKWYEEHVELLVKYKLKEKDLNQISQDKSIVLRKGVPEFLKFTNENNIPVIIISAGISNIIEGTLKKHGCLYENIYILSNIFRFKNGQIKSLRNKIIHSLNKDKLEVPPKIKDVLKEKDEVILIGDNVGDTLMCVKKNSKTIKIGFLNYEDNNKLSYFQKHFDIIYDKDASFFNIIDKIKNT